MLKIIQFASEKHKHYISELFLEYFTETNMIFMREYNISFDVTKFSEKYLSQLDEFLPSEGRLLLARYKGKIVGCAGLRQIDAGIGEVKRMYVKPEFRGKGIGRSLLENIIYEAANIGYSKLLLDATPFSTEALSLYRSLGFQDTEPYVEKTEIPPEYRANWVFMKLSL